MSNIKEDYVSCEIARMLEKKGFNETCYACYEYFESGVTLYKGWMFEYKGIPVHNSSERIKCPTQQMVMKWLRQKRIYINIIYGDYPSLNKVFWTPQIDSLEGFDLPDDFYKEYDKYEEAVEAALKYCLENLIK